ncbi:putative bifunctional diguanylate cyclase/phosphodiesterase [Cryptosporangium phraense]|uniref:Bifunctional diguanylate cyclase/phosphodiesterase n=1 Tax=Cryptosporangium phraense TaxID=2593070 RepID=A0A545AWR5_9ACTN|nr:bifunctional diguanylate cyclase/phosphodiesterase [Cryptosporangium phraense]TQS45774.1 bifunctional diguanylate cyclase/phosphodiesterase [Cryptosporangium phraense]
MSPTAAWSDPVPASSGWTPRRHPLVATAWCVATALMIVHAAWVWTGNGEHSPARLWSDGAPFAVTLLIACGVIATRAVTNRHQRWAWMFFAVGVGLNGAGYFIYDVVAWSGRVPSASLADVVWFPVIPHFILGIWTLARARVGAMRTEVYVGAGAVALLAASLFAAAVGSGALTWDTDGPLDSLVNLYYPTLDMVMLGSLAAVATLAGGRLGRAWGMIAAAVILTALADAWLARLVADAGTDVEILDPCWSFAGLLIAAAAWQRPHRLNYRPLGLVELATPLVSMVLAAAMVVGAEVANLPLVVIVLAAGAIALSAIRLGLGLHSMLSAAEYHRLALSDDLTGLYNRRGFLQGVEEALGGRPPTAAVRAVLMLDLDHFKDINDGLGHQTGDRVLAAVGTRLADALDPDDLVARLGGDEFAVLTAVPAGQSFADVVERLFRAVRQPLQAGRIALPIDVSIGVTVESDAPEGTPAERALELLRCADMAMYRAKAERKGWTRFDPLGADQQRDALELAGELRTVLTGAPTTPAMAAADRSNADCGWLELHYQPLVAVSGMEGIRAEALIRWVHPRYGMVPPDRFVGLAERTGLVPYLTRHVLQLALDQVAVWRAAGAPVTVSVNLSASDMASPTLMDEVLDGLAARGLPPEALTVEITEQTAIGDLDTGRDNLAVLRRAGIGVAIDDFGTGYSALSYLQRLPATELKLDRSLTTKILEDPAAAAIVQACIDLAHTLGLEVVAEGIETQDLADALVDRGCDWLQGWLFGRPAPAGPVPVHPEYVREAPARVRA